MANCCREMILCGDYPCTWRNILCCPFGCLCCWCKSIQKCIYETHDEFNNRKRHQLEKNVNNKIENTVKIEDTPPPTVPVAMTMNIPPNQESITKNTN